MSVARLATTWAPRESATHGPADAREVVPAVSDRMVLDDELRGDRGTVAERERRRLIQLLIGEPAHCHRRLATVLAQQMERLGLRDLGMVTSVAGIQLGDDLPRDIGHRVPARDGARQVDLDRVDEGDVVHDLAHRSAVGGRRRDPCACG